MIYYQPWESVMIEDYDRGIIALFLMFSVVVSITVISASIL